MSIIVQVTDDASGWPVGAKLGFYTLAEAIARLGLNNFVVLPLPVPPAELSEADKAAYIIQQQERHIVGADVPPGTLLVGGRYGPVTVKTTLANHLIPLHTDLDTGAHLQHHYFGPATHGAGYLSHEVTQMYVEDCYASWVTVPEGGASLIGFTFFVPPQTRAGQQVRYTVYTDTGDHYPGTQLFDTGPFPLMANYQAPSKSITLPLAAGKYWVVVSTNETDLDYVNTTPVLLLMAPPEGNRASFSGLPNGTNGYFYSPTFFATPPTTFPADLPAWQTSNAGPFCAFRSYRP